MKTKVKAKGKAGVQLLVIDMSSQYTKVINRTLREIGYRSIVLSSGKAEEWLQSNRPKGIIISGGVASVYEENAPQPPEQILKLKVPILGICYGMQWLAQRLGGEVKAHPGSREYGPAQATFGNEDPLFSHHADHESTTVWMSHGDSVTALPKGFGMTGLSVPSNVIIAMSNLRRRIWGVQFHPEVRETVEGKQILKNFCENICGCVEDWESGDEIKAIQQEVLAAIGDAHVLIGMSGGVDSSFLGAALEPVLGKRLHAVTIDHGALRENELREIRMAAQAAKVQLKVVRAAARFRKAIGPTINAECKRRHFKGEYAWTFDSEAKRLAERFGKPVFVAQGSLATDFIESGKVGEAALIKSHHNIGLKLRYQEIHPLRNLFKYEVRDLAAAVGLPDWIVNRHPFPGPGLFIRVVGKSITPKRLTVVRWADARVREILQEHNLWNKIAQCPVAMLCLDTVGIKGEGRVYRSAIVVRPVTTFDFMTTKPFHLPVAVEDEIISVVGRHRQVVRVFVDYTPKPPATTEME
ncbi:glutamine-hydrolyzing GMP synthase [Patescibacteria group bacterium]|nr:MAG: glutamine-hydrolyzing GMP synthase [Patescibacteria group bacterium]